MTDKITAGQIKELLKERHWKDVYVEECKDGPTHSAYHFSQMDAWVMKKSWSKPLTIVHEIKTNRSDFLNDHKWVNYLPYCNELYFVCPHNLIDKTEVPADAGLIWASKNCKKLYTKKKAPYRDVEIPDSVFRYILMFRSQITREHQTEFEEGRLKYWESWLENKEYKKHLGHKVKEAIREEVESVKIENEKLKSKIEKCNMIEKVAKEMNIDINRWLLEREVREKFEKKLPEHIFRDINGTIRDLNDLKENLEKFNNDDN